METDEHIISLSQEEYLRGSRYVRHQPEFPASPAAGDEPPDFPVSVTPIVIDSLPASPQQDGGDERAALEGLFETPPVDFASADGSQGGERRHRRNEKLPIYVLSDSGDGLVAVDLGGDADLVFSEAYLLALRGIEAGSSKAQTSRVSKRGISPQNLNLDEASSKRSKLISCKLPIEDATGQPTEPSREEALKFFAMLSESFRNPPSTMGEENTGSGKKLEVGVGPSHGEESEAKRRLEVDSSSEAVELEREVMKMSAGQKEKMKRVEDLTCGVNNLSVEGNSDRGKAKALEMDNAEDCRSIRGEKRALHKRVLPSTIAETWTFAGDGGGRRCSRNVPDAGRRESAKFTEIVTNAWVGEAAPVTENATEAARGEVVTSTRDTADAGRGELSKITGCSMDNGVGEAAASAEHVVKAGDVGGRGVGKKNNRNRKYVLLDMIKEVMRITESEAWRSQRAGA